MPPGMSTGIEIESYNVNNNTNSIFILVVYIPQNKDLVYEYCIMITLNQQYLSLKLNYCEIGSCTIIILCYTLTS